ncbi:U2 small nuclear ribonucleoprotein A' isoform X2 [Canis lupus baileyi]|uniref:U2 small nuclear ribonucleoprotein A' isoform X2 n=1 Tax=Canis lupus dingo TaxID=286419 RepID=UPI0020C1D910|nr:U2 small nuclear ribonucleoprotein A' isoform X2 [Canis lupus dingo]
MHEKVLFGCDYILLNLRTRASSGIRGPPSSTPQGKTQNPRHVPRAPAAPQTTRSWAWLTIDYFGLGAERRAHAPAAIGYKIPVIENLGATLDQFDAIDFSDNEIRKLDGFPLLRRLKTLLVNNNRICRIGEGLDQALPCLTELILTNNSLVELGDLDPLASLKSLTYLSILRNPVTNKKHYRLYVIYKVPQVRVLDFQKVKLKERQEAEKMFKGKRGAQLAKDIARRSKTFNPGAGLPTDKKKGGPSPGDVEAIKNAIANASTLAEVERLKGLLQSGQIPGRERRSGPTDDGEEEMEEDTVTNGS